MQNSTNSLSGLALQKFRTNFWSVLSFAIILLCGCIALLAYVLAPDNSQNANQMHISIHSKSPGFSVDMLKVPSQIKEEQSTISKWFNGNEASGWEYPYQELEFTNTDILVYPYIEGGALEGMPKKVNLSNFKGLSSNKLKKNILSIENLY